MTREERLRSGILAPEAQTLAAGKPLREHLSDYINDLRTRNRSREYYRKIEQRVTRLLTDCAWHRLCDINADSFISWRHDQTLSAKTLNDYQHALCALLAWLKRSRRIPHNPIEDLARVDGRGQRTFERRAFTDDEATRLLAVSESRRIIYLFALHTGLRKKELRELLWTDLDLDSGFLHLRAQATKSRRADTLPLTSTLVAALREHRQTSRNALKVFDSGIPSHHTVQSDLAAASIPRRDDRGHKVDFHALRTTFITNLQVGGVLQRSAMALARHTDPRLTAHTYTDTNALPLVEAVACLPTYSMGQTAHGHAQTVVPACHSSSRRVAESTKDVPTQVPEKQAFARVNGRQSETPVDTEQKWSRGELNPRPGSVSTVTSTRVFDGLISGRNSAIDSLFPTLALQKLLALDPGGAHPKPA